MSDTVRHDPDPGILRHARDKSFRVAISVAYKLATGDYPPGPDIFHKVADELDEIFGAYDNCEIACTKAAATSLITHAKMTQREAELVSDMWLVHWREGKDRNCPRPARCPNGRHT